MRDNPPMQVFVTDMSALDFYRKVYPPDRAPKHQFALGPTLDLAESAYKAEDVWSLLPTWATSDFVAPEGGSVHVFTHDALRRSACGSVTPHVWTVPLPEGAFYPCGESSFVSSPEFTFLHLAPQLSFAELIALGDELCGLYAFDESAGRGFRKRSVPLTTVETLRRFAETSIGRPGYRRALTALKYVVPCSASPMETLDEMLLCLPYRLGGYGLPAPEMNSQLTLSGRAAAMVQSQNLYADMLWPKAGLVVEHNGGFDHSSLGAQSHDRARVNAIVELGYEVIELTGGQVGNLRAFEAIASRAAKTIGKRIKAQNLGATPQRIQLRSELFAWNRAYGRHPAKAPLG